MANIGGRAVAGALIAVGLALLSGCRSGNKDEVLIGEFASKTGSTATFGIATHNGIQLAIDEANAAGGINGKPIRLISEDDQSKPDVARTVVSKLVTQNKVLAVLGEVASTRSMAAAPVCEQYKVPMISPSSTNPEVTRKGKFIFRVCFTDDFQAAVVAKFAFDQGFRKVAIFKDVKNDYSVAFGEYFTAEFVKLGGKIVGVQSYQEGDTDFKAQLNSLKGSSPDAILCPGYYSEVGTIARQCRDVGLKVPLLGGDGWDSPELIGGAGGPGGALEGSFFSNHYFSTELTDPDVVKFIANYKKKYGDNPGSLSALGYDAARLLIEAIRGAKTLDGPTIRDTIAQTKDFAGVTGKITLDENRNARKAALILQIKGSTFHVFKTYTPEQLGK